MKPLMKKFLKAFIILVIIAALATAVIYFDLYKLDWISPTLLVEQISYEEVFEINEYEDAEYYDSTNAFMGAEIRINVRFLAHILPLEKLPEEYKKGEKKEYSSVNIYVKDVPSLKALEKMREALESSKYLKLIKNKEIRVTFRESKLGNKKVKRIEEISVKSDGYFFVKY
jgi:hypothetical protein